MRNTETVDVSHIRLSSMVQPTEEDMELWESLTPEEQHAVFLRDLDEARKSGIAPHEIKEEILARIREDSSFEEEMNEAQKVMNKYKNTLNKLAN